MDLIKILQEIDEFESQYRKVVDKVQNALQNPEAMAEKEKIDFIYSQFQIFANSIHDLKEMVGASEKEYVDIIGAQHS